MSIEGRIAIDIGFTDTHTTEGVQNVQRIALSVTDSYTSGKAVVLTGTVGTAVVLLDTAPTTFRDASGSLVSFADTRRVIVETSRPCEIGDGGNSLVGQTLCMFQVSGTPQIEIHQQATSGTSAYTAVFYGT